MRTELLDQSELTQLHRWLVREGHSEAVIRDHTFVRPFLRPGESTSGMRTPAAAHGMVFSLQGDKAHFVPAALGKDQAALEVWRRVGAERLLAAGDSLLDAPMLEAADAGIRPAHGELHLSGRLPRGSIVTANAGPAAAEDILQWAQDTAAS